MRDRRMFFLIAFAMACASAPEPEAVVTFSDNRTPLKKLADSTSILMKVGVDQSDSASLRGQLANAERNQARQRQFIGDARRSAMTARESFIQAMEKGDRLRDFLGSIPSTDESPRSFSRYWSNTRVKLDMARSESHLAVMAADSALVCGPNACTGLMTALLRSHLLAAAGAAHEAHSLLRIAMTFVKK